MTVDELLEFIFNQGDLFSPTFSRWIKSSERFRVFAEKYKEEIRDKVINAQKDTASKGEAFKDVLFELEIAYLMLKDRRFSKVEYEFHGKKGPDFTVTDETGIAFNVEVKRIRRAEAHPQTRFNAWKSHIKKQIHTVPSTLALYMRIGDDLDTPLDLVDRLKNETSNIINWIVNAIPAAEKEILVDGKDRYSVPVRGFEGEFELEFRKPPWLTDTLVNDGGEYSIFKTGKEYDKFYDLYWKVFKNQIIPGWINVLVFNTDSKVHDEWALKDCISYLNKLAQRNDIEKTKQLSGVLFRGAWFVPSGEPNVLWYDKQAYCPIPDDIGEALRRMD